MRVPKPEKEFAVGELVLPPSMIALLTYGRWKHPGDEVMQKVLPWFEDPLDFLPAVEEMRRESCSLGGFADDDVLSSVFRVRRGSTSDTEIELPWLDAERAVLVAVNRIPGDDVAIALDFREIGAEPRVVASDIWSDPSEASWRLIAPTVLSFAEELGL